MIDKKVIKKGLAKIFTSSGAYNLFRHLNRRHLPVIYYHRVVSKSEVLDPNLSGMFVGEDEFENQLRWLQKHYKPISEQQLTAHVFGGESLPDYPIMLTFDDGYKDNFNLAYPLLKKYHIPWTLFVTTGYVNQEVVPWFDILFFLWQSLPEIVIAGKRIETRGQTAVLDAQYNRIFDKVSGFDRAGKDEFVKKMLLENPDNEGGWANLFCSWEDLRAMKDGAAIGAHTRSHQILSELSESELNQEIIPARDELTARLGQDVTSFAYPNGSRKDFNDKTVAVLQANNFQYAFSTCYGLNDLTPTGKSDKLFNLNRIGIDYFDNLDCFKMKISGGWKLFDAINS